MERRGAILYGDFMMKGFGIGDFRGYFWNIGGPGQGRRIFVGATVLYFAAGPHFGLAAFKHLSALTGTFPSGEGGAR